MGCMGMRLSLGHARWATQCCTRPNCMRSTHKHTALGEHVCATASALRMPMCGSGPCRFTPSPPASPRRGPSSLPAWVLRRRGTRRRAAPGRVRGAGAQRAAPTTAGAACPRAAAGASAQGTRASHGRAPPRPGCLLVGPRGRSPWHRVTRSVEGPLAAAAAWQSRAPGERCLLLGCPVLVLKGPSLQ